MKLLLENIRCFAGRHDVEIRPLTLLVGENSSGKTTILAMLSVLLNQGPVLNPQFNVQPYSLGNFDTIATYRGGRSKPATSFGIGLQDIFIDKENVRFFTEYKLKSGRPEPHRFEYSIPDASIIISITDDDNYTITLQTDGKKTQLTSAKIQAKQHNLFSGFGRDFEKIIFLAFRDLEKKKEGPQKLHSLERFLFMRGLRSFLRDTVRSIAPIRTSPRRTYDEIIEGFEPGGDHIPFVLNRILSDEASKDRQPLIDALTSFGRDSGLFKDVTVKRLGRKDGDPFQIIVTPSGGPAANLMDVGYGVSQALPVIIQSVLSSNRDMFLIQQPEVHLHPKAQAALGTFFTDLVKQRRQFVIETHSDYIVDRIRTEVADKKIKSQDVVILYFDKKGADTTVHEIYLDDLGNLINTPNGYRDFFMDENLRLLRRGTS